MTPDRSSSVQASRTINEGHADRSPENERSVRDRCPECRTETVVMDMDRQESVCSECGLVLSEKPIDRGPEWRSYDATEQYEKSRVGRPLTESMHDRGLTTSIDWRNRDAKGNDIDASKHASVHRLRVWQERIRTKNAGERNLKYALSEIDRMSSALDVPRSVRETASVIYRRALDLDLIVGRSIEGIATSALYIACRKEGIPRSLEEMTTVSRVDRREIGRSYRYLCAELDINLEPTNPRAFVPRFCSELDTSQEVERLATKIVDETTDQGLHAGKSPTGFAAAAIYVAGLLCEESIPQRKTASVAQTTVVTIRNHYREQLDAIDANPPN